MPEPAAAAIPVTIIGGYLGAGKTTLVNHMLRHAQGRKLAVLVNEFGDLPIDADLIEAEDDDLISIAGGCICCSFGSDLTAGLMKLAALARRPDHVLIECSGVAIPGAIAASLSLLEQMDHDGTLVLLDAETGLDHLRDDYIGDTIARQIEAADLVLLTKADLADPAPLRAALAPKPVIPVSQGRVPLDALLGLGTSGRAAPAPVQAADHADALFQSTVLDCTQPLDPAVFSAAISTLGLTRAKGFFLAPGGTRQQFHLAGARIRITPAPEEGPLGIVCIGLTGQFDPTLCHRAMKDAAYP